MIQPTMTGLLLLVTAFSLTVSAQDATTYKVRLIDRNFHEYNNMLDGRDPLEIKDISTVATTRMTLEPLILQVAPVLGGCNCRIEYAPYEVHTPHARSIEQVRSGAEITHGIAGFTDDSRYADGIMLSEPILTRDEFYVGFYTHDQRADLLSITSENEIQALRYVVGRTWELDNRVLNERKLTAIRADSWDNLIFMIVNRRADVVLQPFIAGEDLSFYDDIAEARFIPIPGFRMKFGQGRNYIVSKNHPDGDKFLKALNRGISKLREDGILRRAMINAGVINEKTERFIEVNFD